MNVLLHPAQIVAEVFDVRLVNAIIIHAMHRQGSQHMGDDHAAHSSFVIHHSSF